MFDEVTGLPLHPLAVHAPVVLIPLTLLLSLLFAVPRFRAWARTPLLLVALAAAGSTFVARQSGHTFRDVLEEQGSLGGEVADIIDEHQEAGDLLFILVLVFAGLVIIGWLLTRGEAVRGMLGHVVAVVLVLGSIGIGYQVYRVGDLGSEAVWNPTGELDYAEK